MTDEITAFVRARLDEDEQVAREAIRAERAAAWTTLPGSHGGVLDGTGTRSVAVGYGGVMEPQTADHIADHDPARVLRDVEAQRELVARYEAMEADVLTFIGVEAVMSEYRRVILPQLALPYADHPDYRPEWRP